MSVQAKAQLNFDDWLADERAAFESRSEYVNGEILAMTGASEAYNLIVTNTVGEPEHPDEEPPLPGLCQRHEDPHPGRQ